HPGYPGYPGGRGYPGYPGTGYPPGGTLGIDLFGLLRLVKRHALLIAACTVVGVFFGVVWLLLENPEYEATAVVRVGESRQAMVEGIETPRRDDGGDFWNPFLSDIQLLTSRSVVGAVVDSLGLQLATDDPALRGERLQSVRVASGAEGDSIRLAFGDTALTVRRSDEDLVFAYGAPVVLDGVSFTMTGPPEQREAIWTVRPREQAIDGLLADLRVMPRNQTNVVDISYMHPSPHVAQGVVNTLAETYQRFEGRFAQERAALRRAFLEEQLSQTEGQLAQAQNALSAFQRGSRSYDAAGEITAEQQNRMLLRVQIAELESQRRVSLMMLDSLDSANSDEERWTMLRTLVSSPGIAENPVVTQMHDRVLEQRSILDELTAGSFGAAGSSPEVQRQRELVESAEQDLINSIRSHVRSLDARAAALEELEARTDSALATLPAQRARGERLSQVVTTYQTLADQLREDLQRARMAEEVSVGQADIIDLASLPYEPAPRLAMVKLGLGLFLGLTFGGVGATVAEYRRRSLDTKEEVETLVQVPVLGVIPRAADPFALEEAVSWTSDVEPEDEEIKPVRVTTPSILPRFQDHGQKDIYSREAFRMLCTNLLFAGWTKDAKTLSVTSTLPQEGKTLVTTNLAVAMANEGLRVLLVDADVWRGRVHEIFDVPVAPGLGEILQAETSMANGPRLVRKTPIPGLSLLPRGETGSSPSLLSQVAPLRAILEELTGDFDLVLVDGPPVLAAGTAPVLSAATDGVVMLVQAGRVEREAIEEALKGLQRVGANLRGAVLNDPKGVSTKEWRRYAYYEYAKS
ncbi:MAG: polysaccharide biosynthesis tyrosine autokinase, partial [Longimicrobiales bacterium]|nr:polysaccharide biosynthesis tyrosine autokinase [Longimicrobiales bacterium]